jgi:hypothetical protein
MQLLSSETGLPDGLFSNQKSLFGYILEGPGTENVCIFMTIWNILWPYSKLNGTLVYLVWGNLVYFSPFWYVWTEKIWQLCAEKRDNKFFKKLPKVNPRGENTPNLVTLTQSYTSH